MEKIELIKICDRFLKSIPKNLNYITPRELKDLIENDSEKEPQRDRDKKFILPHFYFTN